MSGAESIFRISRWRGLNENPDGDTELLPGEAAEMRNFRVTEDGSLQLRPGYRVVSAAKNWSGAIRGVWSGNAGGREVTVFAAGGRLWEFNYQSGSAAAITAANAFTNAETHFFGFDGKAYAMNGSQYFEWVGSGNAVSVAGYRPLVAVSSPPAGGGTELERTNMLTGAKRVWYSPAGSASVYQLPEKGIASVDYAKNRATGVNLSTSAYTVSVTNGTVTFTSGNIPAAGINSLEIGYTSAAVPAANMRAEALGMRFSEVFNGIGDNRVFFYGDGTNRTFYSGIDYDGKARADYIPALNVMHIGVENTPLTAMIRYGSRLMAFKTDSAFSISYGTLTLADGRVTAAFYNTPVSRATGCIAPGQAQLVGNSVRTLADGAVYEWKSSSGPASLSVVSRRAGRTVYAMDLTRATAFYDRFRREYYVLYNGVAAVNSYATDTWYVYTNFRFERMFERGGEIYGVTPEGDIAHISMMHRGDAGRAIDAVWRSGEMSFGQDFKEKHSGRVFVTMKPEPRSHLNVSVRTNRQGEFGSHTIITGLAEFTGADFRYWSFRTDRQPKVNRLKIRAKKFSHYQLVLRSRTDYSRATVLSADIRLRRAGEVR